MKTITIQIGNTDNKLSQQEWHCFVKEVNFCVKKLAGAIHFFGGSENWASWQNVAWVIVINDDDATKLKELLTDMRKPYKQDSVAWTEGETLFI